MEEKERYKVKRFSSCYLMNWVDNKTNKELTALEIEEILHKQEKRIAELEEKLKNAIVPKFKIGQEVWYAYNKYQKFPFKCVIDKIVYDSSKNYKFRYDTSDEYYICVKEEDLFATEEEAEQKLAEIGGKDE